MSLSGYIMLGLSVSVGVFLLLWRREASLRARSDARAESLGVVARESMDAHAEVLKILEDERSRTAEVDRKHDLTISKIKEVSAKIDIATGDREKVAGLWSKTFSKGKGDASR